MEIFIIGLKRKTLPFKILSLLRRVATWIIL